MRNQYWSEKNFKDVIIDDRFKLRALYKTHSYLAAGRVRLVSGIDELSCEGSSPR